MVNLLSSPVNRIINYFDGQWYLVVCWPDMTCIDYVVVKEHLFVHVYLHVYDDIKQLVYIT